MGRQYINQFSEGESINQVFVANGKQLRPNRQGNLYLQLTLSDKSGSVNAMQWNANQSVYDSFENGDYVIIKGTTQLFNGNLQIIVQQLKKADESRVDEADFVTLTNENIGQLIVQLRQFVDSISHPQLQSLCQQYLDSKDIMEKFSQAPAGVKNHHAYQGGLIHHVVSLMELAESVVQHYPEVDRDLVLAGVLLHDLSKTDELAYERSLEYTDEGQLVGHLVMGVELLGKQIDQWEANQGTTFPNDIAIQLKHMIVSHHGQYDFGSPKLPMTLEALVLHMIDNLDAKVHQFSHAMDSEANPGDNWTPFIPTLGRKLYKKTLQQKKQS
ncbi:MAG: 3'-5' exoribonuclease YhaM family protein [Pirellulaceae bacterium]|nr:OB-fold nucleic acid binding domain-containing protein [Pirellulales bacterium]|tara:strand:+ start:2887 stop:3870 length:984 start_codon:yes stop_codon:yes gene_type:complete